MYYWKCPECETTDIRKKYNGKERRCHDCMRWYNMNNNSYNSFKKYSVEVTREEFQSWLDNQELKCDYCGIPQDYIEKVGLYTSAGKLCRCLGIDRKDSSLSYTLDNMILCCLACNRVKSDVFTYEEFKKNVAPGIRRTWLQRLGFSDEAITKAEEDRSE